LSSSKLRLHREVLLLIKYSKHVLIFNITIVAYRPLRKLNLFKAKDLKEIALALRQKRQNELEQFEQNSVLEAQNDVALRNKRSGCGCCCCCCCCCCGCGRKKRQILTILRARRNSVADEIIKEAANGKMAIIIQSEIVHHQQINTDPLYKSYIISKI
jgi:hypothetical protein